MIRDFPSIRFCNLNVYLNTFINSFSFTDEPIFNPAISIAPFIIVVKTNASAFRLVFVFVVLKDSNI